MDKPVRLLLTGGTIDKIHDPVEERLAFATDGKTQIPDLLRFARCHFLSVQQIMQIDSLEMTDTHRAQLKLAISAANEEAIVITHGTSTMGETARFLRNEDLGKTIVLTGAMRPFSIGFSDGPFNLGGAVVAAQLLPAGVYGVMNGRVFEADQLNKNVEQGRFDV